MSGAREQEPFEKLQVQGHQFASGYETPENSSEVSMASLPSNRTYVVNWTYGSPDDDPERFESIDRADAIVDLEFLVDGQFRASTKFRVQIGFFGKVWLYQYWITRDSVVELTFVPSQK